MTFLEKKTKRRLLRTVWIVLGAFAVWWVAMWCVVPSPLLDSGASTLLRSSGGELLGARIAPDGQWRFPLADSVPSKFAICIVNYEDRRFWRHWGVDPAAVARALRDNRRAGEVVSGGSTLTMQLARIARGNRPRNLYEKAVESLWALWLETRYGKRRILSLYASGAPFGGNVVGVETAAWRYFGRSAAELSWAESATLAVLPNSPALIHPGRSRDKLKAKRDRLLATLARRGIIDPMECELARLEPLPDKPLPLPDHAPHLLERLARTSRGTAISTSIIAPLQRQVQRTIDRYGKEYASNHIYNLAAVVAEVSSGRVVAYVGNVGFAGESRHGNSVDVVTAPRSSGSILKPFLFAGMLDEGSILPGTLVSDTPLNIDGFIPKNFNGTFTGAVPASEALERSLNVPLVRMLSHYNTGRFMELLKKWGMTTLVFSEEHYGASLILGGAEATLWDLCGMYASMSRTLGHYYPYDGLYDPCDIHPLTLSTADDPAKEDVKKRLTDRHVLSAASIWFTYSSMSGVNRPEEEADWQQFRSMKRVAWKTGTSWGGRDAWAVGTTPRYVVGVWVGNASGEGRPNLTGVGNAAPVLFDIFSLLPDGAWFEQPYGEMERMAVCRRSGHRAMAGCEPIDTLWMPTVGGASALCPYHRTLHLSPDGRWQVDSSCEAVGSMITRSWFVLPPAQEFYYRNLHADYASPPPWHPDSEASGGSQIDVIYPEHGAVLYLPKGFSGEREKFVFRAAHAHPETTIYWHLDGEYLGQTTDHHQISCTTTIGRHTLTLTDPRGNRRKIAFEVIAR